MQIVDSICNKLNLGELENIPIAKDLSNKFGVKPAHLGFGAIVSFLALIFFGIGASWITFVVGFLYPAYMTLNALESPTTKSEDDKQWLTYWVVFTLMMAVDEFIGKILRIIPFYNILRIVFYVWLFHPQTKGASVLYNKGFRPMLKKHELMIDDRLSRKKRNYEDAAPLLDDSQQQATERIIS